MKFGQVRQIWVQMTGTIDHLYNHQWIISPLQHSANSKQVLRESVPALGSGRHTSRKQHGGSTHVTERGCEGAPTKIKIEPWEHSGEGKTTAHHGGETAAFKTGINRWKWTGKMKMASSQREFTLTPTCPQDHHARVQTCANGVQSPLRKLGKWKVL